MNILIADDEATCSTLLQLMLHKLGHTVIIACNGQQLVELFNINKDKIDIVITDIMMPVLNGLEASKIIKRNSKVPIVAVTSLMHNAPLYDNGGNYLSWTTCDFYLRKRIVFDELEDLLKKIKK